MPLPGPDPVEQMSWMIGLLLAAIEDAATAASRLAHPHPRAAVRRSARRVPTALRPTSDWAGVRPPRTSSSGHNTPGTGFVVKRVASELPDSWRHRLDDEQVATLRRVLGVVPGPTWTDRDFIRDGTPEA